MRSKDLGLCLAAILSILAAPAAAVMDSSMEDPLGTNAKTDGAEGEDYLSYNLSSAFSFFSEFYTSTGTSVVGGLISTPVKFDISKRMPAEVHFGTYQPLPYSKYVSAMTYRSSELWVQGATDWSQFVVSPIGKGLQLVAYAPGVKPAGELGGFYEIIQNETSSILKHNAYTFFPGYNTMSFNASQVGRHMLFFAVDNQSSNVVIVDVFDQPAPPAEWPQNNLQQYSPPVGQATTVAPKLTLGDTPVTIKSAGMRGYQVFLDGVQIGTEGSGGDPLDGSFSFSVSGGMYHNIRVYDGQFDYPKRIYFQRGVQKIIYVEPGTAVYI